MDKPNPGNRKEISAVDFERLLQRLDADLSLAGQKYEDLRWMLIHFFELNGCIPAEELADETLNRIALKLETEVVRNLQAFAWGVARNIKLEAKSRMQRFVAISDLSAEGSVLTDGRNVEEELHTRIDEQRQLACLDACVRRLPKRERHLFLAYYSPLNHTATRQRLAEELGVTGGALRIRMIRLRYKVQKCTEQCISSALYRRSILSQ